MTDEVRPTLGIDDDDLSSCVSCGLCLPHCPTWRLTGDEAWSPRGRIDLMRGIQWDDMAADAATVDALDGCIGCLGCEPACPAGVPFGSMIETTRTAIEASPARRVGRLTRFGLKQLGRRHLVKAGVTAGAVAQRLGLFPKRIAVGRLPLRNRALVGTGDDVIFFTGCIMDAAQRHVHRAGIAVLGAAGFGVELAAPGASCCGALAAHTGMADEARSRARATMAALGGAADDRPIVVDSAGCGAQLQHYGALLGTAEAAAFSERVVDLCAFLARDVERMPEPLVDPADAGPPVAIQDPCHLRHVQRDHAGTRVVLGRYRTIVELDDDGLCCGAGGAYSLLHAEVASGVRDLKVASIERSGAPSVASANPGCGFHLEAGGVAVAHPIELVAAAVGLTQTTTTGA